ncbi:hypothetical protein H1R20_g4020, partial [Candolleomyces eurysporus]
MGKGGHGKSSATSATRKKHAKKNAPPPEEPVPKTKRGKKERGRKAEPRQKIYIPPVKPPPVQPDPLETTGLAHTLPADLLIVLRSFNKKAEITKIRALEELQTGWVDKCIKDNEDEVLEYTLVEMLPVWLHHVSALFLHSSRRVRALTASLHLSLLHIAPVKEQIFFFLRETASTSQVESFLGSWCIAAHDVDKAVATTALKSWKEAVAEFQLEEASQAALVEFVQRTALDPAGIYAYLNPIQPSITPGPSHPGSRKGSGRSTPAIQQRKDNPDQLIRTKLEESEENEQDRKARLRFGALGAIKWILESVQELPEIILSLFSNPAFLTSLQSKQNVPWIDLECFGYAQPAVRKNTWALLLALLSTRKGALESVAPELSRGVLRSAFIETDPNVQSSLWHPLLLFLKELPTSWELEIKASQEDNEDDDDNEDSENEDDEAGTSTKPKPTPTTAISAAYQEFLQFLQLGCSGSPVQGYSTVIIVLSTIPSTVIAASSSTPIEDLFTSFWAALDGRALSALNRVASSAAFLSSLLECMALIVKRVRSPSTSPQVLAKLLNAAEETEVDPKEFSVKLVEEQIGKIWRETLDGRLKVDEKALASSLVRAIGTLGEVDTGLAETSWTTLSSLVLESALSHPSVVARLVKELRDEAELSSAASSPSTSPAPSTSQSTVAGKLDAVVAQLAEKALDDYASSLSTASQEEKGSKQGQQLLADLLETFKDGLFFANQAFTDKVDALVSAQAYEMLKADSGVFISILRSRGAEKGVVSGAAWVSVLTSLAASEDEAERERLLKVLVAAPGGEERGVLDDFVGRSVAQIVAPGDGMRGRVEAVKGLLVHHEYFVSSTAFLALFDTLCTSLVSEIQKAFEDPFFSQASDGAQPQTSSGNIPWIGLETLFGLVLSTYKVISSSSDLKFRLGNEATLDNLASEAFLYGYLLPLCEGIEKGDKRSFDLAAELWKKWYEDALEEGRNAVVEIGKSRASRGLREVKERLKGLVLGTKTRVLPQNVLSLLSPSTANAPSSFFAAHREFGTDTVLQFLPTLDELDRILDEQLLPGFSANASMGVLDPLVPPASAYPYTSPVKVTTAAPSTSSHGSSVKYDVKGYDRYGYSAYARAVSALVTVFARDRAIAKKKEGVEVLRHLGVLEVAAWDMICVPNITATSTSDASGGNKVFGERALLVGVELGGGEESGGGSEVLSLAELITKIEQVMAYVVLAGGGREPWRRYVLDSLSSPTKPAASLQDKTVGGVSKTPNAKLNLLANFTLDVIARAVQSEMDLKAADAPGQAQTKERARALKNGVVLNARVLRRVLERVFDDSDSDEDGMKQEDVEKWVGFARKVERSAPLVSSTILATITSFGLDSPRLDRARNEFAASLLGLPLHKANSEGLELLRSLGACVPPEDADDTGFGETLMATMKGGKAAKRGGSDVIILPVQRAVNVVRACQKWVEGQEKAAGEDEDDESEDEDEGPSEDLESAMLAVFIGLAPILQNVPGKHWEFIWDVLETVLENSTLDDESMLLGLSHALRLVRVMEDLVRTNKQLKAEWDKRRVGVLGNVRDLLLAGNGEKEATLKSSSMPRSVCRELVLAIVQSLPEQLIDQDTLGKMCHLVTDSSLEVQRMSYAMLRKAAEKRTEWVVIEVGVGGLGNAEGEAELETPAVTEEADIPSLQVPVVEEQLPGPVDQIPGPADQIPGPADQIPGPAEKKEGRRKDGRRRKKKKEEEKDEGPSLLPRELLSIIERDEEHDLFGWMLGWMLVFDLFKDASFKVKSMYIEQLRNLDLVASRLLPAIIHLLRLDEGLNKAVKVELWAVDEFYVSSLAAHLYFRALLSVPSLILAWVLGCKDRQLNNAFTSLTSLHYSPLIIRAELAHLKSPEGAAELSGEGMTVKVVGGNSEVVAAYVVDDHQLEIKLKIPADWPLHRIEVRDEKRVGVDEKRWRAWVLAVQQTIWTHNGRLVDGLSLFKKNVTLHFEGQVECAICYSIISASDGSLPKKPCKTCRNRFHSSCLYKWFNTSHSSSCPLCRSNII